jgi:hypothetical protein
MTEFILKIGKIDEPIEILAGNAKKSILVIRDALRDNNVEADVIVKPEPKILD